MRMRGMSWMPSRWARADTGEVPRDHCSLVVTVVCCERTPLRADRAGHARPLQLVLAEVRRGGRRRRGPQQHRHPVPDGTAVPAPANRRIEDRRGLRRRPRVRRDVPRLREDRRQQLGFRQRAASLLRGELSPPVLRWVTTSIDDVGDERVALVTHESDVPTARLASLVAPCLVVSGDKHLRRPGFAPDEWRPAVGHGAAVVEASGQQEGVAVALGLPMVAVVSRGIKLGQAARPPGWASLALMAGGGDLIFRSPERRTTIGEKIWPFVEAMFEMMAQAEARQQAGARGHKEAMFDPATPRTDKQQVATVLARARQPLLAKEVQELIERHFDADDVPTIVEVRDTLTALAEFTQPERYRWQLGRIGGPVNWLAGRDAR